jgi:hypothetical protein
MLTYRFFWSFIELPSREVLERLNAEARVLEERIVENVGKLLVRAE